MEDPRRDFGTFDNGEVANSVAIQYWSALFTRKCNFSYKIEEENSLNKTSYRSALAFVSSPCNVI